MNAQLFWHLLISFGISGFIATTQGFFVIEWATQWGLFPLFFQDARPDRLKGIRPISLRMRGFMWAVSASVCPIGSLLLLLFAPPSPGTNPLLFGVFVGVLSFTARFGCLPPTQAVGLLKEFLRAMVEAVESEHGGMINKFLGDGFMALFGIGSDTRNHADKAVAAACSIQRTMERLNAQRAARGEDSIQIGIGINTGPAIVGSIGSPERMEFTVIGNTVNVASRI